MEIVFPSLILLPLADTILLNYLWALVERVMLVERVILRQPTLCWFLYGYSQFCKED